MARVARVRSLALDELHAVNPEVPPHQSACVLDSIVLCPPHARVVHPPIVLCLQAPSLKHMSSCGLSSIHAEVCLAACYPSSSQLYYASLVPDRTLWPLHFPAPTDTPPIEDYTTTEAVKI